MYAILKRTIIIIIVQTIFGNIWVNLIPCTFPENSWIPSHYLFNSNNILSFSNMTSFHSHLNIIRLIGPITKYRGILIWIVRDNDQLKKKSWSELSLFRRCWRVVVRNYSGQAYWFVNYSIFVQIPKSYTYTKSYKCQVNKGGLVER